MTLTKYLSLRPFYSGVGGWDNRSSSCTRDSARQPHNANVPTGSLGYDVYPTTVHVTDIFYSYLHQSRHRDSATETRPQQVWRTVTDIYTRLTAETWWQQFFRRLSNCDAPSQLISLVTASLELLGFEIRSRQAISIPKHKVLLVSPLRCLANRAVDRGAFAISLSPSRQARNGSLLASSKLHPLSFFFMNYYDFLFLITLQSSLEVWMHPFWSVPIQQPVSASILRSLVKYFISSLSFLIQGAYLAPNWINAAYRNDI